MLGLALAAGWIAMGAGAVALMRRRGHDAFAWAVPFLFLGPLAVPIAVSSDRHRPSEPPRPLRPGGLDLLVSHDGSPDADAALEAALILVGPQMTSMTLAAVIDLEATSTMRGRDTQRQAQERLDAIVSDLAPRTSAPVATVVLHGDPATALHRYAIDHGYELIVAGSVNARSLVGGRRTGRPHPSVPVLIGPARSHVVTSQRRA